MKFYDSHGEEKIISWGDHWPGCASCRSVNIDKSATFVNACAQGSPLLMEEMAKQRAPIAREGAQINKQWARDRGTFHTEAKTSKALLASITKYK